MNITEIVQIIEKSHFDIFEVKYITTKGNNEVTFKIEQSTFDKLPYLGALKKIPIFEDDVTKLYDKIRRIEADSLILKLQDLNLINASVEQLRWQISGIARYYYYQIRLQPKNYLRIKLPELNSFEELSKVSSELKQCISIPIADSGIDTLPKIFRIEPGSIWINVELSEQAVSLIGAITWAAVVLWNKHLEHIKLKKQVEELDLHNDMKQNLIEAQGVFLRKLVENEADFIIANQYQNKDINEEHRLRLINSINLTMDLLERGAQIKPSLDAPSTIISAFPDLKKIGSVTSKIKRISEHSEDSGGNAESES